MGSNRPDQQYDNKHKMMFDHPGEEHYKQFESKLDQTIITLSNTQFKEKSTLVQARA